MKHDVLGFFRFGGFTPVCEVTPFFRSARSLGGLDETPLQPQPGTRLTGRLHLSAPADDQG